MPDVQVWGELNNSRTLLQYARKTVNGRVIGANYAYGDPRKHYPRPGGRFFGPQDEEQKRRVAFLGYEIAEDIFGKEDPVGKTLLLNSSPFTVIGVTPPGFFGETLRGDPADLWIPVNQEAMITGDGALLRQSVAAWLRIIGRL